MKFVVGVMLTSFGMFWGAEGAAGGRNIWPGSDAALLALVPAVALFGIALTVLLRRSAGRSSAAVAPSTPVETV